MKLEREYEPGEIVEHRLNKEWLMILQKSSKSEYLCRTKSFEEKNFKSFELIERRK